MSLKEGDSRDCGGGSGSNRETRQLEVEREQCLKRREGEMCEGSWRWYFWRVVCEGSPTGTGGSSSEGAAATAAVSQSQRGSEVRWIITAFAKCGVPSLGVRGRSLFNQLHFEL
jgi:hypothetical protein